MIPLPHLIPRRVPASQLNLRRNDLYLRFIPVTAGYVRDNCKKYPELERLGELLYIYKVIEQ